MDELDDHLEANLARLLEAACGEEALLDPALREHTRQQLAQRLHLCHSAPAFPDRAVALLGLLLAGTAAWLAVQVAGGGIDEVWRLPGLLIALPLSANLLLVPVATVVVLQGRQKHDQ